MTGNQTMGSCSCGHHFPYTLIHTGFGESAYAYCDRCGMTAYFDGWAADIPPDAGLKVHSRISAAVEPHLAPCECGGRFTATASPRCTGCREVLSAEASHTFIEANAPGTSKGWRWQGAWDGLYCIVIDGRIRKDPWKHRTAAPKTEA